MNTIKKISVSVTLTLIQPGLSQADITYTTSDPRYIRKIDSNNVSQAIDNHVSSWNYPDYGLFMHGDANVTINKGSAARFNNVSLNSFPGPSLSLSGAGTTLTTGRFENYGANIRLSGGATVSADTYNGDIGTLIISGPGSQFISGSADINRGNVRLTKQGAFITDATVKLRDGGTLTFGGEYEAEEAGTLQASGVTIYQGVGNIKFNHTSDNYLFDHAIATSGTGKANIILNAGTTTLTARNSYKGTTTITKGTLRAGTDDAFSANSDYLIESGKGVLTNNGFSQTLKNVTNHGQVLINGMSSVLVKMAEYSGRGKLSVINAQAEVDSLLDNQGIVQVSDGGRLSSATLNNSGLLSVSGPNSSYTISGSLISTGTVAIGDEAELTAGSMLIKGGSEATASVLNIGSVSGGQAGAAGRINTDTVTLASTASSRAVINMNHNDLSYGFNASIKGNGDVTVESGRTRLNGINDYAGSTLISGGVLEAGRANAFSHNSAYTIRPAGSLNLAGFSQQLGNTLNDGTINLTGNHAGTILTINGHYAGNNGTLIMGTRLEDDASTTDRVIVTGDASGTTKVHINNLGGRGAETQQGIELIRVEGRADSSAFQQAGRAVAGAYDYRLAHSGNSWYLTNRTETEIGPPDDGKGDEQQPGSGKTPGGDKTPGSGKVPFNGKNKRMLRPEGSAYATNLAAAATLFDTRLSDRDGTYYRDPLTGEEQYTSLWLRLSGDRKRMTGGEGQLKSRSYSAVTLLGGDIAATDAARLGVMAGYGNSKSKSHSVVTGYRAQGQINGYSTGIYGSWFPQSADGKGAWADSTLQYSWFDNSVSGENVAAERYSSKGLSASFSTGYVMPVWAREHMTFFIQPQARVSWSGIKADDHIERNGTRVQANGQNNISTSLGVKAFMRGILPQNNATGRYLSAYAEANWIRNTRDYGVQMDNAQVSQSGSRNIAEVRAGLALSPGRSFSIKTSIGQQIGDKDWSDTSGAVSIGYHF